MLDYLTVYDDITTLAIVLTISAVVTTFTIRIKSKYDILMMDKEILELEKALEINPRLPKVNSDSKETSTNKNVLAMMADNVSELKEYYIISKQQARKSFSAALYICFLGIFIYILGIVAYVFLDKDISLISIIGGTVVEIIAGLFFWLYKEATNQLSIYHQRLGSTERYLIAYQMLSEISEENRYKEQSKFIDFVLTNNISTDWPISNSKE